MENKEAGIVPEVTPSKMRIILVSPLSKGTTTIPHAVHEAKLTTQELDIFLTIWRELTGGSYTFNENEKLELYTYNGIVFEQLKLVVKVIKACRVKI